MSGPSDLGYAQARIQARYGDWPDAGTWQRLAATQSLRAYLETARATSLAPWVENLSDASDVHDVEASVRGSLYGLVLEVARWVPPAWSEAVAWARWLAYLPAIRHLLAGEPPLPWMARGHRLRPFLQEGVSARAESLARQGAAPLVAAWRREEALADAWLDAWRARWPVLGGEERAGLEAVQQPLEALRRRLAEQGAGELAVEVRERLVRVFRREALAPGAVFAFLGIHGIDLIRLRGDLVARATGV